MMMIDETVCTEFEYDPQYLLWLTYKSEGGHFYYVVSDKMRTEYYRKEYHGYNL